MRGPEIMKQISENATTEHCFVRWWRKENDFMDYDLLDRFMEDLSNKDNIGGISLMTMDEMWGEVQRIAGGKVKLVHAEKADVIEWEHDGKSGRNLHSCMYTPENLIKIFDVETKGNPIS